MKSLLLALLLLSSAGQAFSQGWEEDKPEKLRLDKGLKYNVEMQADFSSGSTPLWLNANRYGLSSLDETNGYVRAGLFRPLRTDSARRWGHYTVGDENTFTSQA